MILDAFIAGQNKIKLESDIVKKNCIFSCGATKHDPKVHFFAVNRDANEETYVGRKIKEREIVLSEWAETGMIRKQFVLICQKDDNYLMICHFPRSIGGNMIGIARYTRNISFRVPSIQQIEEKLEEARKIARENLKKLKQNLILENLKFTGRVPYIHSYFFAGLPVPIARGVSTESFYIQSDIFPGSKIQLPFAIIVDSYQPGKEDLRDIISEALIFNFELLRKFNVNWTSFSYTVALKRTDFHVITIRIKEHLNALISFDGLDMNIEGQKTILYPNAAITLLMNVDKFKHRLRAIK